MIFLILKKTNLKKYFFFLSLLLLPNKKLCKTNWRKVRFYKGSPKVTKLSEVGFTIFKTLNYEKFSYFLSFFTFCYNCKPQSKSLGIYMRLTRVNVRRSVRLLVFINKNLSATISMSYQVFLKFWRVHFITWIEFDTNHFSLALAVGLEWLDLYPGLQQTSWQACPV